MNIVYITILLLAVSDKIPSHLDFLKSTIKCVYANWDHTNQPTKVQRKCQKEKVALCLQTTAVKCSLGSKIENKI